MDSIWARVVYLSQIPTLKDMYTMSNAMIIAEATIDSLGYFSFRPDYLPEEDQLFRVHISKVGAPAASLIIGGSEENHLFLITNKNAGVFIENSEYSDLFEAASVAGYHPSKALVAIDKIARYADSTKFNGSSIKRDFVSRAIDEKLRYVADTSSHQLVSLYALNKSNFESNFPVNEQYYENFFKKWKSERSPYLDSFKAQLPIKRSSEIYYYILLGLAFFALGFFLNWFLKWKGQQKKSQLNSLSVQERKIFDLLQKGHSNKEISEEYSIGLSTVKSHVSSI